MERAILKTLIYADIFDYPLTLREIHKWLIGKKAEPRQIKMDQRQYYCLPGREKIIKIRKQRARESKIYLRKAKIISQFFKIIPFIKLVGISGGLAMDNAGREDDIDLFVVTAKNRLWLTRLLALGILQISGQRRKATDATKEASGKICLNILLEEDCLQQSKKNLYTAHEVLQMKPLWFREGMYSKYLEDNSWAFKLLPNWTTQVQSAKFKVQSDNAKFKIFDAIENIAKKMQLKIMQKPQGQERIEEGAVYFHPKDHGEEVLKKYLAGLDKVC